MDQVPKLSYNTTKNKKEKVEVGRYKRRKTPGGKKRMDSELLMEVFQKPPTQLS